MSKPKIQKAFIVQEDYEGVSKIIFHHHALAAKRLGAEELGMEFEEIECRRAPQYDKFFPQVPIKELVENGWWWNCVCGQRLEKDEILRIDEKKQEVFCKICARGE